MKENQSNSDHSTELNVRTAKGLNGVPHAFCSRRGGVSSGLFSSLNCSKFVGDSADNVSENLEIARKLLSAKKLITLKQVHGIRCVCADENTPSDIEADALVTKTAGVALGILTADCVPVLFSDPVHKIVGAAHAGWKGAFSGVIESTVAAMISLGAQVENISAAIGPCVHCESYQVAEDFVEAFGEGNFRSLDFSAVSAPRPTKDYFTLIDEQLHFDMLLYCRDKLHLSGIDKIDVVDVDTVSNPAEYFSFRYAKSNTNGVCGRNISLIML